MSRQMPELYLRGAIFNETMKNLSQKQINEVENKINILLKDIKDQKEFIKRLENSGLDYKVTKNGMVHYHSKDKVKKRKLLAEGEAFAPGMTHRNLVF